jgi:hypothetical protein
VSTVSGQEVRLGPSGAKYVGVGGSGVTVLDADPLPSRVLTPAGISCEATDRGIECTRGGHGFVVGDTEVVLRRGPSETRFSGQDLATPPPAEVDLPTPTPAEPDPYVDVEDYVVDLGLTCDDFFFQDSAQATFDLFPESSVELDADGNGLACEELPDAFVFDPPSYPGVDLGDETETDRLAFDGLWAETCPGGSCYGAISDVNGLPRTTYVRPYTRSDGTFVGAHYRSSP